MSVFTEHKAALEKAGYTVEADTVRNAGGNPIAGQGAYGVVWYKDEFVEKVCTQEVEVVRARNDKGHYIKDDPSTPENEAWTTKVKKAVTPKKKATKKAK
jgi:hypothetical protein